MKSMQKYKSKHCAGNQAFVMPQKLTGISLRQWQHPLEGCLLLANMSKYDKMFSVEWLSILFPGDVESLFNIVSQTLKWGMAKMKI